MPQSLELASSCCSTSSSSLFEHQASNSSDSHTDNSPPISDEKQTFLAERVWYIPHRISRSRPKEARALFAEEELDYDAEPEEIKETSSRGNRLFTKKRVASGQKRRSSVRVTQEKVQLLLYLGVVLAGESEPPSKILPVPQKPRLMATTLPGSPSPASRMFSPLAPSALNDLVSVSSDAAMRTFRFISPMCPPSPGVLLYNIEHAPGLGLVYMACQVRSPIPFVDIPLSPPTCPSSYAHRRLYEFQDSWQLGAQATPRGSVAPPLGFSRYQSSNPCLRL
ncbi:hypothetical protein BDZ89DRAFT_1161446 [Hymenopellis radicata]|nr:hypothetical protein BDZ89DRAFT_1161446 [Hymenopellis radicata]